MAPQQTDDFVKSVIAPVLEKNRGLIGVDVNIRV